MQMMPAVLEGDLEMFGSGHRGLPELGFKVFLSCGPRRNSCTTASKFLKDNGGVGVGMSSWGPALYALGEDLTELHRKTEEWLATRGGGAAILTKANNTGMRLVEDA